MTWRISPNVAWTYDEDGVAVATVPERRPTKSSRTLPP